MAYIDDELIQSLRKWFHEYVETFCTDQSDIRENILLKKKHTKCVCGEILRIGRSLGVSGESLRFAEIIALFHDVGFIKVYDGHEEISMQIAREALPDFGYSQEDIETIISLHPSNWHIKCCIYLFE